MADNLNFDRLRCANIHSKVKVILSLYGYNERLTQTQTNIMTETLHLYARP